MLSKVRASAEGEDCQVRLPGICNYDTSKTVLAHLPGGGMGAKRHDIHGAYACSSCHDVLDGRRSTMYSESELKMMHYEAVFRTQEILIKRGIITC